MADVKPNDPASFSFVRAAVVLTVLAVLILTNPLAGGDVLLKIDLVPRQTVDRWNTITKHVLQQEQSTLLWLTTSAHQTTFTNYGLLTLGSNSTTVTVDSLFHSHSLCRLHVSHSLIAAPERDVLGDFLEILEVASCTWIGTLDHIEIHAIRYMQCVL